MISQFYEDVHKYLLRRISNSTTYRGMHLVQHQRLPIEKLGVFLNSIFDVAGVGSFIEPSNDDPSPTGTSHKSSDKRRVPPGNTAQGCKVYWDILDDIANANVADVGATFNSLKKNTFPNLEGMGLLVRISASQTGTPKKAQLTKLAVKFINGNPREKIGIFSYCNENVLKPMISVLDSALNTFDTINVFEMMLFLTDVSISVQERIDLVGKYKRLKRLQVIQLHLEIQNRMSMRMGPNVPKIAKLDWHNWWNESKQITNMLNTVVGFSVYQNELIMKAGNAEAASFSTSRSQIVKREAITWHNLVVMDHWELHHIVPVEYATGSNDLRKIDDKRNLLYIPSRIHRSIAHTSNLMVAISFDPAYVVLSNPLKENGRPKMEIAWPRDVGINPGHFDAIVEYNKTLLEIIAA